jgi:hypothetical protein
VTRAELARGRCDRRARDGCTCRRWSSTASGISVARSRRMARSTTRSPRGRARSARTRPEPFRAFRPRSHVGRADRVAAMAITYAWRGDVSSTELNSLHADAFQTRVYGDDEWDWVAQLAHSLGLGRRTRRRHVGRFRERGVGRARPRLDTRHDGGRRPARHQGIATELVARAVDLSRAAGCGVAPRRLRGSPARVSTWAPAGRADERRPDPAVTRHDGPYTLRPSPREVPFMKILVVGAGGVGRPSRRSRPP